MAIMTSLKSKLRKVLKDGFPGGQVTLHDGSSVGKVGGMVVWDGFVGKDQIDRQREIRRLLEEHFDPDERGQFSGIFTMTSYEMDAIKESSRED